MFPFIVLVLITSFLSCIYFFKFIFAGKKSNSFFFKFLEVWTNIIVPAIFLLMFDLTQKNECCGTEAMFSPAHRSGIYIVIVLAVAAYFYSSYRKTIAPPLAELLISILLITGIVINVLLCFHIHGNMMGSFYWPFGNIPIIFLFIMQFTENQQLLTKHLTENGFISKSNTSKFSLAILRLQPEFKTPVFLLLMVPLLSALSLLLYIFGQQPDNLIRSFTETYHYGFSQLDYLCENVQCGGHFLCSVGANGHKNVVRPVRYGERLGRKIICTRQLLISNAFEELLIEKMPRMHRFIRRRYNIVGKMIHRYYFIFNNKYFSDVIYLLMKPLELLFLTVLYLFDRQPENRIAIQYIHKRDKQLLSVKLNLAK